MATLVSGNVMNIADFYSNWAYANEAAGSNFKYSRSLLHHCEIELGKRNSYSSEAVSSLNFSSPSKGKRSKNSKSAPSPRSPKSSHKLHEQLHILNKIEEGGYGSIYKVRTRVFATNVKHVNFN